MVESGRHQSQRNLMSIGLMPIGIGTYCPHLDLEELGVREEDSKSKNVFSRLIVLVVTVTHSTSHCRKLSLFWGL